MQRILCMYCVFSCLHLPSTTVTGDQYSGTDSIQCLMNSWEFGSAVLKHVLVFAPPQ